MLLKVVSNTITSSRSYGYSISAPVARKVTFTVPEGAERFVSESCQPIFILQRLKQVQR